MTDTDTDTTFLQHLARIADALEKHSPTDPSHEDIEPAAAYVWNRAKRRLTPVKKVNRVDLPLCLWSCCRASLQRNRNSEVG